MAGSPYQTTAHIAEDLEFMHGLQPEMVGIGPFIPHHDTPFKDRPAGTLRQTLLLLAIVRLMLPDVLLPATTALGTIAVSYTHLGHSRFPAVLSAGGVGRGPGNRALPRRGGEGPCTGGRHH